MVLTEASENQCWNPTGPFHSLVKARPVHPVSEFYFLLAFCCGGAAKVKRPALSDQACCHIWAYTFEPDRAAKYFESGF